MPVCVIVVLLFVRSPPLYSPLLEPESVRPLPATESLLFVTGRRPSSLEKEKLAKSIMESSMGVSTAGSCRNS